MATRVEKRLTAIKVNSIKKPGFHADGGGLYLRVEPGGSKSWALRITVRGKSRTIGLGSIRDVTLAEARERVAELRKVARQGGDPIAARDRRTEKQTPTFAEAAVAVHAARINTWRDPKHGVQWINSLRTYAFPTFGEKTVDKVTNVDVMDVLTPIWIEKPETARRVRQRMRTIFDWAIARHHRDTMNPVDAIRAAMPRQPKSSRHFEALPYREAPAFLIALAEAKGTAS
ncbi:MAG: tyrosine-type recombinase/integrase, partial [Geminicoccaceae bacterium]